MSFYGRMSRIVVITSIASMASVTSVFADAVGQVNDNSVNVRSASSTESDVLTTLDSGQEVTIINKEGDFYKISCKQLDATAYISSKYVSVKRVDGKIAGSDINIRKEPSTDSEIVGKASSGDKVEVVGATGSWYAINYNGGKAYVHMDFLSGDLLAYAPQLGIASGKASTSYYAIVTSSDGLILRNEPSKSSNALNVMPYDEVMDVVSPANDWVGVIYKGQSGYVSSEFVEIRSGVKPSRDNASSSRGYQVVAYGKQFLGTPYRWGGTNLKSGVDCSGFVYSVMKEYGIRLNRSSASMAASNGYAINKSQLRAGDLVFFDTSGSNNGQVSHVGIYMDNGQFIHSSSSKRTWGVTISSLNEDYYKRTYVCSKRVID